MSGRNVIAFAAGPTGSGKTRALWELFIEPQPRRLSIDVHGEVRRDLNRDAIDVYSYAECRDALCDLASVRLWHVAYVVNPADDPEAIAKLARLLAPPIRSRDATSYALQIGGLALDCSEADLLAPNNRTTPEVRGLFQRGRHHRLSLFMATQAPALVDRNVTSNAQYLLAFRTQETTVWRYWQSLTSSAVADTIAELGEYQCAYIVKGEQRVYVLDRERHVLRVLDYEGRDAVRPASRQDEPADPSLATDRELDTGDGADPAPPSHSRRRESA